MPEAQGCLVLVVGPSGVGKDSLLAGARVQLADDPGFVFPAREITRPADAGGEDHIEVSPSEFAARLRDGGYALAWEAHGLLYGIPGAIASDLAAGRVVVVNVSRGVLNEARTRFPRVRVLSITAPLEALAVRLAARGRETSEDASARLNRAGAYLVDGADVVTLANDGSLEQGVDRFVAALRGFSPGA